MNNKFFFEIGCEPIPSNLQLAALKQMYQALERYGKEHLCFGRIKCYITSQRMSFVIDDPELSAQPFQLRKGPLVSLGEKALDGFLRSCNVAKEDCHQEETPKGAAWFAPPPTPPSLEEALILLCQNILNSFVWPESIALLGGGKWIRPIRSLSNLYNETLLSWSWSDIHTQRTIYVHRLSAQSDGTERNKECARKINHAKDYESALLEGLICADFDERVRIIKEQVDHLSSLQSSSPSTEGVDSVIHSNAGLSQCPKTILGSFNPSFLQLPEPVIQTTLHDQQRCISLKDKKTNKIIPHFILVVDGPVDQKIAKRGYEGVISSRLSDALFFWKNDQKKTLDHFVECLRDRTFFEKIGSLYDKTCRVQKLIAQAAKSFTHTIQNQCRQAAGLCYADLSTNMVKEFPNLQGIMGYHYAIADGKDLVIAKAIQNRNSFYKKPFPDNASHNPTESLLAVADGLDTLVGFFALGHAPSGSKDPLALRRTSHNIWRAALAIPLDQPLVDLIPRALSLYHKDGLISHTKTLTDLESFLQERLVYILKKDTPYHDQCVQLASAKKSPRALLEQCKTMNTLLTNYPDFLFAYKRIYSIANQEKRVYTYQDNLLDKEIERKMLSMIQKPVSFQEIPDWTQTITSFMNSVLIQEEPYRTSRLGLLQKTLSLFESWGPIHLLSAEEGG